MLAFDVSANGLSLTIFFFRVMFVWISHSIFFRFAALLASSTEYEGMILWTVNYPATKRVNSLFHFTMCLSLTRVQCINMHHWMEHFIIGSFQRAGEVLIKELESCQMCWQRNRLKVELGFCWIDRLFKILLESFPRIPERQLTHTPLSSETTYTSLYSFEIHMVEKDKEPDQRIH